MRLRIGTRASILALQQTNWVRHQLTTRYPEIAVEVIRIRTSGDMITDVPLAQVGGKGLFVKEIEEALLRGTIDLAVHSMKDIPTELPPGLHVGIVTVREDHRDVLVSSNGKPLHTLRDGARIGTSSLRRQSQLLAVNPTWQVIPLRGNLDTRLRKLTMGNLDAVVLAAAGMHRMGLQERIVEYLSPDIMLPAVGQGALGIECRSEGPVNALIAFLHHGPTAMAVTAERAFLRRLEGGCQVPIAAYGDVKENGVHLRGMVARLDGSYLCSGERSGVDPDETGQSLAEELLNKGAADILRELYTGTKDKE